MNQQDFDAFSREFQRLLVLRKFKKQSSEETAREVDVYFHALDEYPLSLVCAKIDAWLKKETEFPFPADLRTLVIRTGPTLQPMTPAEASEHRYAETNGYEAPACTCAPCLQAGVSEKPVRYVPTLDRDERTILKLDPTGQRTVTVGHWAHGPELFRWYDARASFYNRCLELGLRGVLMPKRRERTPSAMETLV